MCRSVEQTTAGRAFVAGRRSGRPWRRMSSQVRAVVCVVKCSVKVELERSVVWLKEKGVGVRGSVRNAAVVRGRSCTAPSASNAPFREAGGRRTGDVDVDV